MKLYYLGYCRAVADFKNEFSKHFCNRDKETIDDLIALLKKEKIYEFLNELIK
jgi:hypothetical protein